MPAMFHEHLIDLLHFSFTHKPNEHPLLLRAPPIQRSAVRVFLLWISKHPQTLDYAFGAEDQSKLSDAIAVWRA
jgi:hypothetical protein